MFCRMKEAAVCPEASAFREGRGMETGSLPSRRASIHLLDPLRRGLGREMGCRRKVPFLLPSWSGVAWGRVLGLCGGARLCRLP